MDDKVWRVIMHQSNNNNCGVLDSFKFHFRLSQALDTDAAINNIMDSVHAVRDENEHVGFVEALDQALRKFKFVIKSALKNNRRKEEETDDGESCSTEAYGMNIWELLLDESTEDDEDLFKKLRLYILFC